MMSRQKQRLIISGSADQAFEGRHYYGSMRVHKECFDALVQFKVEEITSGHTNTEPELLFSLVALRKQPCSSTVDNVLKSPGFEKLLSDLT